MTAFSCIFSCSFGYVSPFTALISADRGAPSTQAPPSEEHGRVDFVFLGSFLSVADECCFAYAGQEEAEDSSAENSTKAKSKAKKQKKQEKEEAEFDPDAAEDVAERSEDEDEESGVEEEEPAGLRRSTRAKAKRRDTLEEDSNSSRP